MRLLAIDLGYKCGFAYFDGEGRLDRYGSTNFGNRSRFKRGAYQLVADAGSSLQVIVVEGDSSLAAVFEKLANKRDVDLVQVSPRTWRRELLLPRQMRSGADAKEAADALAREVISWSELPGPTSLRHDAAEAILIGLWGCITAECIDLEESPL